MHHNDTRNVKIATQNLTKGQIFISATHPKAISMIKLSVIMLSVIMLCVVAPFLANKIKRQWKVLKQRPLSKLQSLLSLLLQYAMSSDGLIFRWLAQIDQGPML